MPQCYCHSAALSTKPKSPKSVKSRNNRDIKVANSRVKIKLRCFRQIRGTFVFQKLKMSLAGVFPCAWSEKCNSLIKYSDPEHIKITRAVSGFGIQGNKCSPCSRVGWEGLPKAALEPGGSCLPLPAVPGAGWAVREWQRTRGRRGLGAATTSQGCQDNVPKAQLGWARLSAGAGAQLRVWVVPVETALRGEVLPGLILTRNCEG